MIRKKELNMKDPNSIYWNVPKPSLVISARVLGLNLRLQEKSSMMFSSEIVETVFLLEFTYKKFTWELEKVFKELKEFYHQVMGDSRLRRHIKLLTSKFPPGEDGDLDPMALATRKEMVEKFMIEFVEKLNIDRFKPLDDFIQGTANIRLFLESASLIKRAARRFLARRRRDLHLFQFYSKDLMDFVLILESGIDIFEITVPAESPPKMTSPARPQLGSKSNSAGYVTGPADFRRTTFSRSMSLFETSMKKDILEHSASFYSPEEFDDVAVAEGTEEYSGIPDEQVLWLDVCEDPALSRICIASKVVFEMPKQYEDLRLANGIFLSDIAEVRLGAASVTHLSAPFGELLLHPWIKPEMCVSIVGSERTLDIQLLPEAPGEGVSRQTFVDMLNLLSMQSLGPQEARQRRRFYRKLHLHEFNRNLGEGYLRPPPQMRLTPAEKLDAMHTSDLLCAGIEVEEEALSAYGSSVKLGILPKTLRFHPEERVLSVGPRVPPPEVDTRIVEESHRENCKGCTNNSGSDGATSTESFSSGVIMVENTDNLGERKSAKDQGNLFGDIDYLAEQRRDMLLDDIAEIRPGRVSMAIDSEPDSMALTIVSSGTILCLPIPNKQLRDQLIRRFQLFIEAYRDYECLNSDHPNIFKPDVTDIFEGIPEVEEEFKCEERQSLSGLERKGTNGTDDGRRNSRTPMRLSFGGRRHSFGGPDSAPLAEPIEPRSSLWSGLGFNKRRESENSNQNDDANEAPSPPKAQRSPSFRLSFTAKASYTSKVDTRTSRGLSDSGSWSNGSFLNGLFSPKKGETGTEQSNKFSWQETVQQQQILRRQQILTQSKRAKALNESRRSNSTSGLPSEGTRFSDDEPLKVDFK